MSIPSHSKVHTAPGSLGCGPPACHAPGNSGLHTHWTCHLDTGNYNTLLVSALLLPTNTTTTTTTTTMTTTTSTSSSSCCLRCDEVRI